MLFDNWKTYPHHDIPKNLLWEYDIGSFTKRQWDKMAITVTHRVIERGNIDDWYALMQLYGGPQKVRKIIKKLPELQQIDVDFVKCVFKLKDKDLKCCVTKQ